MQLNVIVFVQFVHRETAGCEFWSTQRAACIVLSARCTLNAQRMTRGKHNGNGNIYTAPLNETNEQEFLVKQKKECTPHTFTIPLQLNTLPMPHIEVSRSQCAFDPINDKNFVLISLIVVSPHLLSRDSFVPFIVLFHVHLLRKYFDPVQLILSRCACLPTFGH